MSDKAAAQVLAGVGLLGALLVCISAFLPWATADVALTPVVSIDGRFGDGAITLAIAAFAIGTLLGGVLGKSPPYLLGLACLGAVAIVLIGAVDAINVANVIPESDVRLVGVSISEGLWLTIVGGCFTLAGAGGALLFSAGIPDSVPFPHPQAQEAAGSQLARRPRRAASTLPVRGLHDGPVADWLDQGQGRMRPRRQPAERISDGANPVANWLAQDGDEDA